MNRYIVYSTGQHNACWECDGGGDSDIWQVHASTPEEASRLVEDSITLESYEQPVELHAVDVGPSRARKPRILRPSEWLDDWSAIVEPPASTI